ncbi:MAG TPA: SDR family oxidoreductase [Sediminibacterium sp.]|nr:SDR family oxidoreductase [Sediminibacterium sp.]
MNLAISKQLFIVGGATSGLGNAIAVTLLQEGAQIIAVARGREQLLHLQNQAPGQVEILAGDLSKPEVLNQLIALVGNRQLHGIVVNAGGPPAKTVLETTLKDWDDAYQLLLRWKVAIAQAFVPKMAEHKYGRIVFIESVAVKQPIENLVLSNSLRLAVVGMVKTLSQEIAGSGITLNILGPGSHNTPAVNRLYQKKSEQTGISFEEVKAASIRQLPAGMLGEPADFASLAVWLLSPMSRSVTGQTITVDGGTVRGVFG